MPLSFWQTLRRIREFSQPETVLDVGANEGEFSRWALDLFPGAQVHAFEPLPPLREQLTELENRHDRMHFHAVALGDVPGTAKMHLNEYMPSSSLLPMTDLHRERWPKTAGTTEIEVEVRTIDDFCAEGRFSGPMLLKLDVQGFELKILQGARKTLPLVDFIVAETLFEPLYEGQPDFSAVLGFLSEQGFQFMEFADERRMGAMGELVYADAVYRRKALTGRAA